MLNKKLTIALVGLGRISQTHINAISNFPSLFSIKYLVDNKIKGKQNSKYIYIQSYEDVLKDDEVDLIVLCTPSNLHFEQCMLANNFNKSFLCEKPVSCTLEMSQLLISNIKVKNFVALQNRYNPPIKILKDIIQNKTLGKIYQVSINLFWSRTQDYFNQNPWRGKLIEDGAIVNQGFHYLDILIWMFGMPKTVFATVKTLGLKIEAEDSVSAIFEFANAMICSLNISLLAKDDIEGSISVIGEHGHVKVGGKSLNNLEYIKLDGNKDVNTSKQLNHDMSTSNKDNVYGNGHIELYEDVYNSLVLNKTSYSIATIKSDYLINKLIKAIRLSSNTNKLITIV